MIGVEDDGPGIATKYQERLLEPFARPTSVEGSGLGLAFARQAVASWTGKEAQLPMEILPYVQRHLNGTA